MNAKKMLQLPKIEIDPAKTKDLCKCRPVCKGRRREWKGKIQKTSDELLVDRKPTPVCRLKWPKEIPEGLCPLLQRTRDVTIKVWKPPPVVRLCVQPIDDVVDTTYIDFEKKVKQLGLVTKHKCGHCNCCNCCPCDEPREYIPLDADRSRHRCTDMRTFDRLVRQYATRHSMKIMYK